MADEQEKVEISIDAAVSILDRFIPFIAKYGIGFLKSLDKILDKAATLPAPFDKLSPYIKEVDMIVEFFISIAEMELPPSQ